MTKRRSTDDWRQEIQRYQQSGKSQAEFAAELGVAVRTLNWWVWKLSGAGSRSDAAAEYTDPRDRVSAPGRKAVSRQPERFSINGLKKASRIGERIKAGETIIVTSKGAPVACIRPNHEGLVTDETFSMGTITSQPYAVMRKVTADGIVTLTFHGEPCAVMERYSDASATPRVQAAPAPRPVRAAAVTPSAPAAQDSHDFDDAVQLLARAAEMPPGAALAVLESAATDPTQAAKLLRLSSQLDLELLTYLLIVAVKLNQKGRLKALVELVDALGVDRA